jgi:Holliday junction resolvase
LKTSSQTLSGKLKQKKELESTFQERCLSILNDEIGGVWFKIHSGHYSKSGVPDIIGVRDGIAYAIELKSTSGKKKESKLQGYKMKKFINNGGRAVTVSSTQQLREFFSD